MLQICVGGHISPANPETDDLLLPTNLVSATPEQLKIEETMFGNGDKRVNYVLSSRQPETVLDLEELVDEVLLSREALRVRVQLQRERGISRGREAMTGFPRPGAVIGRSPQPLEASHAAQWALGEPITWGRWKCH